MESADKVKPMSPYRQAVEKCRRGKPISMAILRKALKKRSLGVLNERFEAILTQCGQRRWFFCGLLAGVN